MASNSLALSSTKSLFSNRFESFSRNSFSPLNLQLGGSSRSSSCKLPSLAFSSTTSRDFKASGNSGHLGRIHFPVWAVSGGGSGGPGDGKVNSGGGGGGDGGDGDGGGEGGGTNGSFILWYLHLLRKYPVRTKAATSALLNLLGDLICQLVIDRVSCLDLKRTATFTFLGFILVGPALHFWYLYLSKLVTAPGLSGAFLRLLLDQFLFAPLFVGTFLSTLVTLEGKPLQVIPKLRQEWFSSVVANWQLWIPFQFLNFRFVPQQFQVLASNIVALAWNVILSYKAHKHVPAQ